MKIAVSAHGRFHAFDLAREMLVRGYLAQLATTYPGFAVRRFLPPSAKVVTAPWLEALRRLRAKLGLPFGGDFAIGQAFGRFSAAHMPEADIFVGWSGASLEALRVAKQRGMKTVLERGSTHIAHQTTVLRAAHAEAGLTWAQTDPRLIAREEEEYAEADAIAVPTSFVADTFVAHGVKREKLQINPYGVDLTRFASQSRKIDGGVPRILFVGRLGVRKGLPALLAAFAKITIPAELRLVGPFDPEAQAILARASLDRVTVTGPLAGSQLAQEYAAADIFCLPSLEEGMALVLLQAMASGLPVVATPESGAADLMTDGQEGLLIPSDNYHALAGTLSRLVADQDLRHKIGLAARARVESGYSWGDYAERAINVYRGLTK